MTFGSDGQQGGHLIGHLTPSDPLQGVFRGIRWAHGQEIEPVAICRGHLRRSWRGSTPTTNERTPMTTEERDEIAEEIRTAYREGWEPWELPEVTKAILRARGLPMKGARALAFDSTRDLRPTGQRLDDD